MRARAIHLALAALVAGSLAASEPVVVPLIAGQHETAGSVTIDNDNDSVSVVVAATAPWRIAELHVHAAATTAGIPQTGSGNPIPGQFAFKQTYPGGTANVSLEPWSVPGGLIPGSEIAIAVHAVVERVDAGGAVVQTEGAWSAGPGFPGKNWATYTAYTIQAQACPPTVRTYPTPADMDADFGRVDYLVEMRWGDNKPVGDHEVNIRYPTTFTTLAQANQVWGNGAVHQWTLSYDAGTDRVSFAIDGVEKLNVPNPATQDPNSLFMFGVAKDVEGVGIAWSLTEFNGQPIAGMAGTGSYAGPQWSGASVSFPTATGSWTAKGSISMSWSGVPFALRSRILSHIKVGAALNLPVCGG